jgi:DNA-nicking Smr family endonuclease
MSQDSSDDDDLSLFRDQMKDVVPLKPQNRASLRAGRKKPAFNPEALESRDTIEDVFSDENLDEDCPEILSFSRGGLQLRALKQLRAGKYPVEHRLDLHGYTVEQARKALISFLEECAQAQLKTVLIIHGKGFRSKQKPVIKSMVNRWLRATDRVLAFHSAQPRDGGSGAVYVLLRR